MPINYIANEEIPYNIDWDIVFESLNNYPFFYNKIIQTDFLSSWKSRIIKSEQLSYRQVKQINLKLTEHYPIKIMFKSTFIGWSAVNIDEIEKIIFQHQTSPVEINLDSFLNEEVLLSNGVPMKSNYISYYTNRECSLFWNIPIITFCPTFPHLYERVIDGNNRVDYSIKNKFDSINAYRLTQNFFFKNETSFLEDFSRDILLFLADLHHFYQSYQKRNRWYKRILGYSDSRHFLNTSRIFQF